jgi:hypothetical protein
MHYYSKKNYSKEKILIKITAFFWITSKIMSCKLWLSDRLFPIIPPFEFSPNLPNTIHFTLFVISIIGLVSILIFNPRKEFVWMVLILEIASCFLDQMRWQPWEYQYLLLFIFFLFYKKNTNQFLELISLLIGVTYIYSGLHKFNGGFLYSVWEKMILKDFFHIEKSCVLKLWVHYAGLFLPLIETLIGFCLLLKKDKLLVSYFAIGMHLLLLTILIENNHNSVVWPWNIAMILYVWILFIDRNPVHIKMDFFKNYFNIALFILIGILPILSFFSLWDNYLSFNLYSGNVKQLTICVRNKNKYPELEPYMSSKNSNPYCKDVRAININSWALKELNVPIYPEEKTFQKLKKEWKTSYKNIENTFICYWYPYKKDNYKEIQ